MPLVTDVCIYLITGCAAGYLAGLFGVGGGIVIVPVLVFLFEKMAFPHDLLMQIAIGTSMATVAVTAIVSARTHHANGNVDWMRVYSVLPAVVMGVIVGALVCSHVSRKALMMSVIAFELVVAVLFLSESVFLQGESAGRARAFTPFHSSVSRRLGDSRSGFQYCRHRRRHALCAVSQILRYDDTTSNRDCGCDRRSGRHSCRRSVSHNRAYGRQDIAELFYGLCVLAGFRRVHPGKFLDDQAWSRSLKKNEYAEFKMCVRRSSSRRCGKNDFGNGLAHSELQLG